MTDPPVGGHTPDREKSEGAPASQAGPSQVEPVPVSPLRASVPSALDWAAAFGPILKEAFPDESQFKRHAVALALGDAAMVRKSWFETQETPKC